jgi:hypothetical protein
VEVPASLGDLIPRHADVSTDHAAGNYRILMNLADELLTIATDRELPRLDEKLFLETFSQPPPKKPAKKAKS